MKPLILIDVSNLVYRFYYAAGLDNAYSAFLDVVEGYKEKGEVLLIFDSPESKNVRKALYPEYKANRKPMDEDIRKLFSLVSKIDMKKFRNPKYEADDLIYQAVNHFKDRNIVIVSNDSDLQALIRKNVIIDKGKNTYIKERDLKEKYNTNRPLMEFIQVRKALVGDSSDNIKGVSGIGKVKSLKVIENVEDDKPLYEGVLEQLNKKEQEEFKLSYSLIKFLDRED